MKIVHIFLVISFETFAVAFLKRRGHSLGPGPQTGPDQSRGDFTLLLLYIYFFLFDSQVRISEMGPGPKTKSGLNITLGLRVLLST